MHACRAEPRQLACMWLRALLRLPLKRSSHHCWGAASSTSRTLLPDASTCTHAGMHACTSCGPRRAHSSRHMLLAHMEWLNTAPTGRQADWMQKLVVKDGK